MRDVNTVRLYKVGFQPAQRIFLIVRVERIVPDKFNWMFDRCRTVAPWDLKACFDHQSLMWELEDKWMYGVLAAAALVFAVYAIHRNFAAVETGMVYVIVSIVKAGRRIARYASAFRFRVVAMVNRH